jgi:hypothetical protein
MGTATREDICRLVQNVPDEDLDAVFDFVRSRTDPVLRAFLEAPEVDEPLTEEELASIEESRRNPDSITWEEYLAKRGQAG